MARRRNATPTLHHYLDRLPMADCGSVDRVSMEHLGLVVGIARRYWFDGIALDDLIQAGNVGLLHATRSFDPRRSSNLSTWLSFGIRRSILEHLAGNQHAVALPRNVHQRLVRTHPSVGAKPSTVHRFLAVSIDGPIIGDGPDHVDVVLAPQPDEAPASAERAAMSIELISLLDTLDLPARRLIIERFGLDGCPPSGAVAQAAAAGVSREAIRLRYNTAMARLATEAKRRRLDLWLQP